MTEDIGLTTVWEDDDQHTAIYFGFLTNLTKTQLSMETKSNPGWHYKGEHDGTRCYSITLNEISFIFKTIRHQTQMALPYYQEHLFLTVITESPLHGEIYLYGNNGDKWEKVGETRGYV